MEFTTVLMICAIAAFVITTLRRIAKNEIVDLIGAFCGAALFISILVVSFVLQDRSVLWALIFGFWACESTNDMNRG